MGAFVVVLAPRFLFLGANTISTSRCQAGGKNEYYFISVS